MLSLVLWMCLVTGQAEPAKNEALAAQVRQYVRQLNDDQLSARDEAEEGLKRLGADALLLLPPISDRMPAEVAQRLGRVKQALHQAQATAAGQASLITLKGDEIPLAEALEAISKQSGNKIVDHRKEFGEEADNPKLKLDFNKTPFWEALDTVLLQAKLMIYPYAGERGLFLIRRPPGYAAASGASYSGPFRVSPLRFEALDDLQNSRNKSLKLFIEVSWEPRLTPIILRQSLDAIEAVGSGDRPVTVDGAGGEMEAEANDLNPAVEIQIPLTPPPRSVEKIAKLKGKLNALVQGRVETFRFDELPIGKNAKKVEQRRAGVTVIVDGVRKNNDVWEVNLRVHFDEPGPAFESHRGWIFSNEVYLVEKKSAGKTADERIEAGNMEETRRTKDEVGIKYLFDLEKGPAGLSLVYRTPISILEIPVEYELRDLDLP